MTNNVVQEIESTIRKSEQVVLDAIKSWTRTVRDNTPQAPFADRMPAPKAVVSSVYDAFEALLANQRRFAEGVLKALNPGTEKDAA